MDYADRIPGLLSFYGVIIEDESYISVLQEYFPGMLKKTKKHVRVKHYERVMK